MSYKFFIIFIALVCIIGGIIFFFGNDFIDNAEPENTAENIPAIAGTADESEIDGEIIAYSARDGWLSYTDPVYPFSFQFPAEFHPTVYADELGDIIIFESRDENSRRNSFQIFVTGFEEDVAVISPERIRKDLPNMNIIDPQETILGDGSRALIFFSEDSIVGKTREIWIIHNMLLYQITARAAADALLADIMKTWKFLQENLESRT